MVARLGMTAILCKICMCLTGPSGLPVGIDRLEIMFNYSNLISVYLMFLAVYLPRYVTAPVDLPVVLRDAPDETSTSDGQTALRPSGHLAAAHNHINLSAGSKLKGNHSNLLEYMLRNSLKELKETGLRCRPLSSYVSILWYIMNYKQ